MADFRVDINIKSISKSASKKKFNNQKRWQVNEKKMFNITCKFFEKVILRNSILQKQLRDRNLLIAINDTEVR